jgi:hypothetical protein
MVAKAQKGVWLNYIVEVKERMGWTGQRMKGMSIE